MARIAAAPATQFSRVMAEAYAVNDRMNQIVLEHLDPRAWRAKPPGGKGRTIAAIFSHVHNIRRKWLRLSAPHLKLPAQLDRTRCTPKQARAALAESERTKVRAAGVINYAEHAQPIQDIMGPNCFALYEESLQVLRGLRDAGFRLGVISDWQEGLGVFCQELGLGAYLDVVVASSEVGYQKPDPRLFEVASKRMKIPAFQILHVGDTMPDVEGARAAGFSAVLLLRDGDPTAGNVPVIRSLDEVFSCLKAPPN